MIGKRRSEPSRKNSVNANRTQKDNNEMKRHLLVLHNEAGIVTAVEILLIS